MNLEIVNHLPANSFEISYSSVGYAPYQGVGTPAMDKGMTALKDRAISRLGLYGFGI